MENDIESISSTLQRLFRKKGFIWFFKSFLKSLLLYPRGMQHNLYYELDAEFSPKSTPASMYGVFDIEKTNVLIDIGCGYGRNLEMVRKKTMTVGVEISRVCAHEIKKHCGNAIVADAQNLPFGEKKADIIVASEILEHLQKPEKCLNNIYSILKHEGKLYISITNEKAYKLRRITNLIDLLKLTYIRYARQHFHNFSLGRLVPLLKNMNFKICAIQPITHKWKIFGLVERISTFHWHILAQKVE